MDAGLHALYLTEALHGSTPVAATSSMQYEQPGIDASALCQLQMASGGAATIEIGWQHGDGAIAVYGSEGYLKVVLDEQVGYYGYPARAVREFSGGAPGQCAVEGPLPATGVQHDGAPALPRPRHHARGRRADLPRLRHRRIPARSPCSRTRAAISHSRTSTPSSWRSSTTTSSSTLDGWHPSSGARAVPGAAVVSPLVCIGPVLHACIHLTTGELRRIVETATERRVMHERFVDSQASFDDVLPRGRAGAV